MVAVAYEQAPGVSIKSRPFKARSFVCTPHKIVKQPEGRTRGPGVRYRLVQDVARSPIHAPGA
jgi:hypothetical protein